MDFAEMLIDAWSYTKGGILTNTNRWMKLILAVLCLGIPFNGYILRVYRGATPAPDVDDWGTLFVDGLKMFVIGLVYILPLMLVMLIILGVMVLVAVVDTTGVLGIFTGLLGALFNLLVYVMDFIVMVFLPVAYIRFARTGVFAEAFNFSALRETIEKIGWIRYIVAVVLIAVIIGVPLCIVVFVLFFVLLGAAIMFSNAITLLVGIIAVLLILALIVFPVIGVFQARYLTRVYEMAGE
jgi:hypothetical protein